MTISSSQFLNNEAEGSTRIRMKIPAARSRSMRSTADDPSIPVTETISNSLFSGNRVIGSAGSGASSEGGAISNTAARSTSPAARSSATQRLAAAAPPAPAAARPAVRSIRLRGPRPLG